MPRLRMLTAGESHGKSLIGILEGMPSGIPIDKQKIDLQLRRRQIGYGRGGRMQIESDSVEILSGLRFGTTLGSPIAVLIQNKDWANWSERMDPLSGTEPNPVHTPRPGHADYSGGIKYRHSDLRNVLERASARETAVRVALGSIVRHMLDLFDIQIGSHVIQIEHAQNENTFLHFCNPITSQTQNQLLEAFQRADASPIRCSDAGAGSKMLECIQNVLEDGDSVGGLFEVAALNVPVGLGSYVHWDRRLDAALASAFMSIPGIKSVEIGLGIESSGMKGSEVHDAFVLGREKEILRSSNRAGGIEGGVTNGQPVLVRAGMKPIPTLRKPLPSVNLVDKTPVQAHQERSDVCAVPAASIVGESMLALVLGEAFLERYGADSLEQLRANRGLDRESH